MAFAHPGGLCGLYLNLLLFSAFCPLIVCTSSVPPAAWQADYDALCKKLKELAALSGISGLLG